MACKLLETVRRSRADLKKSEFELRVSPGHIERASNRFPVPVLGGQVRNGFPRFARKSQKTYLQAAARQNDRRGAEAKDRIQDAAYCAAEIGREGLRLPGGI